MAWHCLHTISLYCILFNAWQQINMTDWYTPYLKKTSKIIFVITTSNFHQIWQFLAQSGLELLGEPPPPSSCLQTLIFEWKSALNLNPCAKFQTFRQLTPSSFRSIPTLGTMMANCLKLYEVHSFSTSPNSRQCTTVLNADVPNCYTSL